MTEIEQTTRLEEGEPTLEEGEEPEAPEGPAAPPEQGGPATDEAGEVDWPDDVEPGEPGRGGRRLSRNGARFIARYEGFRSKPYNDAVGHCTIGYGHLLHLGNCRPADMERFGGGIDGARGLRMLAKDATEAAEAVRSLGVDLDQHQFDALVSFTFNLGPGWTTGSGLQRALRRGDHAAVPREMSKWVYAGGRVLQGLVNRRRAEGALYARGVYGTGP